MTRSAVQELVDRTLDRAQQEHPGCEFSLSLSRENSLLLPLEARQLVRVVEGEVGYYSGHVYRDCLVWDLAGMDNWRVVVNGVNQTITIYGDLQTGRVALPHPPA